MKLRLDMPENNANFEAWPATNPDQPPGRMMPGWRVTIWRGLCGRCPRCGNAPIFDGYLKVVAKCASCEANLGDMPSDDAPPYIAMVVVLQFLAIFIVLFFKGHYFPAVWMCGLLLVLLAAACMVALRWAKGAVIGILLKLGLEREILDG